MHTSSVRNGLVVKPCKQCGRTLSIESFRKYPYRGQKKYSGTKQGHYTICYDCEAVERHAMRLLKKKQNGELTGDVASQIQEVAQHYTKLTKRGLPPVTKNAKLIVGQPPTKSPFKVNINFVDNNGQKQYTMLMDELTKLLEMEWTEDPDVYDKMIEDLKGRALQDPNNLYSKIRPEYYEIHSKLVDKWSEYEDNYDWNK